MRGTNTENRRPAGQNWPNPVRSVPDESLFWMSFSEFPGAAGAVLVIFFPGACGAGTLFPPTEQRRSVLGMTEQNRPGRTEQNRTEQHITEQDEDTGGVPCLPSAPKYPEGSSAPRPSGIACGKAKRGKGRSS
eukprot:gene25132-biopygen7458